jgi:hypothetical protein
MSTISQNRFEEQWRNVKGMLCIMFFHRMNICAFCAIKNKRKKRFIAFMAGAISLSLFFRHAFTAQFSLRVYTNLIIKLTFFYGTALFSLFPRFQVAATVSQLFEAYEPFHSAFLLFLFNRALLIQNVNKNSENTLHSSTKQGENGGTEN